MTIDSTIRVTNQKGLESGGKFYSPFLLDISPIKYGMSKDYGGFVKLISGSFSLTPDTLAFPPPTKIDIDVKYIQNNGIIENVLTGSGLIGKITKEKIIYEMYDNEYDNLILDQPVASGETAIINNDGDIINDAVIPRYFGREIAEGRTPFNTHVLPRKAQKSGDAANSARYYTADLNASSPNFKLFDDGADIEPNITDRTVSGEVRVEPIPVGEVRARADNTNTPGFGTLRHVFFWATGASFLNLSLDVSKARSSSPIVSVMITEQGKIIDFLDRIAAANSHLFYIRSGTLYLIDMLGFTAELTIDETEYFKSDYNYKHQISALIAEWSALSPAFNSINNPVYTILKKMQRVETENNLGSEIKIDTFHDEDQIVSGDRKNDIIITELINIGKILQRPRADINLPFDFGLITPGYKISYTDLDLKDSTAISIFARNIEYNFNRNGGIKINGEGEIFAIQADPVAAAASTIIDTEVRSVNRYREFKTVDLDSLAVADYTSLEDAITDNASTGASIFIRNGTYEISDELDLGDVPWEFRGESKEGVILKKTSDNANPFFDGSANEKVVTFKDLTIDTTSSTAHISLDFKKTGNLAGELTIKNCVINNGLDFCIKSSKTISIINQVTSTCRGFFEFFNTASLDTTQTMISDCDITQTDNGLLFDVILITPSPAGTHKYYILNNTFKDIKSKAITGLQGSIIITGNTIIMFAFTSQQANDNRLPINISTDKAVIISGNTILLDEDANNVHLGIEAIYLVTASTVNKSFVSSNTINLKLQVESSWGGFTFDVEGIEILGDNITAKDNNINIDLGTYSTSPIDFHGIECKNDNCMIESNTLVSLGAAGASYAIQIESTADFCNILNNIAVDGDWDAPVFNEVGGVRDNVFDNNR